MNIHKDSRLAVSHLHNPENLKLQTYIKVNPRLLLLTEDWEKQKKIDVERSNDFY